MTFIVQTTLTAFSNGKMIILPNPMPNEFAAFNIEIVMFVLKRDDSIMIAVQMGSKTEEKKVKRMPTRKKWKGFIERE